MVFSGSGRHRRPTQADRAIAAAGVASVGLALPLLTAAGAHATPVTNWDAVAQCETGGNWSADDGNGHYGGLGLTQRAWVTHGGDKYAAQPDHATKSQQIAVAEHALADSGSGLWSKCAPQAGLSHGGTASGTASTPTPSATPTPAPTPDAPAATTTPTTPSTPSTPSADTGSTAPGTPDPTFPGRAGYDPDAGVYWFQDNGVWHWTLQHDVYIQHMNRADAQSGAPAADPGHGAGAASTTPSPAAPGTPQPSPSAQTGNPTTGTSAPASQAPGAPATGSATATPQTPAAPTTGSGAATAPATPGTSAAPGAPSTPNAPSAPAATAPQTYTVEHGDTLSDIARSQRLGGSWQHLYEDNKAVIGDNPDLILPGQALHLQQH